MGALLLLAACGSDQTLVVEAFEESIVYGNDDRIDAYAHPDAGLRQLAQESVVAQIRSSNMELSSDGTYDLRSGTLAVEEGVCDDEAFADQRAGIASCWGVLITDDLVLTAGHCVDSTRCGDGLWNYVFNYRLEAENTEARILESDVYSCQDLVLDLEPGLGEVTPDFAIIRLDRPVAPDHAPAPIRPATPLAVGDALAMIGSASGQPATIDTGAWVAGVSGDYYVANLDAFRGHSGSPVFDVEDRLSGILVTGQVPDYVRQPGEDCRRVNTLDDREAGEVVQNVATVIDALCQAGEGGETLCGDEACDGEACGAPPPPVPRDSVGSPGVAEVPAGGCSVSPRSYAAPTSALLLLVFGVVAGRVRRKAA